MRAKDARENVEKYYSYDKIMKDITEWIDIKSSNGQQRYIVMFYKYDWPPMYKTTWFKKEPISHEIRDKVIKELKKKGFEIHIYYDPINGFNQPGWAMQIKW